MVSDAEKPYSNMFRKHLSRTEHHDISNIMNGKYALVAIIALLLIAALLLKDNFIETTPKKGEYEGVFVGIDEAYDSLEEVKTLIDAVSPYTNLFIVGSTGITHNVTKLDEVSQYLYDKGLSFIIYTEMPPRIEAAWIENAKARWGNRFLGLYVYDEIGGKQLDFFTESHKIRHLVNEADNYTDARNQFVSVANMSLTWIVENFTDVENLKLYSSDYALYWFDYESGYDTIFAEFGWNYSRQLNVALNRGAATAQNKEWGVIITWKYTEPPYIESGEQLYDDMVLAYQNGAKYIIIFDTDKNYTHGILGEEHFQALRQFSEYAHKYPRTQDAASERVAFVLPENFAYGFRGPNDKIWGLWEANSTSFSYDLSVKLGDLLEQFGSKLDVIYDDSTFPVYKEAYSKIIFWNGTVVQRVTSQSLSFP